MSDTSPALDWEQVAEALAGAGIAHLATASAAGRPHVAAVMPTVEGDVVWIATNASSAKARNLKENPGVALMWQPTAEIYVWGDAHLVADRDEVRRVWEAGIFPFDLATNFGAVDNPNLVLIRVEPHSATVLCQGAEGLARRRWRKP